MENSSATGSFRPNKRLGQNFLVDPDISRRIVSLSGFSSKDTVLEIGPGKGALTMPLADRVKHVLAVEKDARLAALLDGKLRRAGRRNVTLLNEDILRLDWRTLEKHFSQRMPVIGNLPYNISTPVLEKMCRSGNMMGRGVLMFQKEVADRLTAVPNTKAYGALTLLVRYHARALPLLKVMKGSFFPVPKVDSMVLSLDFERPYPGIAVSDAAFAKVVKGAFMHRRKTVLNSLKLALSHQSGASLISMLETCGVDPGKRAEALEMDDYLRLAALMAIDN